MGQRLKSQLLFQQSGIYHVRRPALKFTGTWIARCPTGKDVIRVSKRAFSRAVGPVIIFMLSNEKQENVFVMVNGIPGKMGIEVAEAAVRRGLKLIPFAFTGEQVSEERLCVGGTDVAFIKPSDRERLLPKITSEYPNFITVDYTHPSAVNSNAEFYCKHRLPFVMGTTGGDRELLMRTTLDSKVYAVIAPNMGKQIVAFQAMMEYMGQAFPGAFAGYKMEVVESHQSSKADTSGTAKAVVASFNKMGVDFSPEQIEMVRDSKQQQDRMRVPEEHLGGHAFHTYTLTSPDGTVQFSFQHNVCGRKVYAEGTIDAVVYLNRQIQAQSPKSLFNMIDALSEGVMQ
mmetsp:Transcript_39070/g.63310  ORF Transcript_39070/g.63310 Transcript_39070/m.63310 type:complete len:343 (-) Transcript_39070:492-1520(-)